MATKDRLEVDFGRAAQDYAKHRPGFPAAFFDHVRGLGIGVAGTRVLDLGTGTGTLACGFAERGCDVVGLDPSSEMLAQATKTAIDAGLRVSWVQGWAEATGLPDAEFDIVCAGQCWTGPPTACRRRGHPPSSFQGSRPHCVLQLPTAPRKRRRGDRGDRAPA